MTLPNDMAEREKANIYITAFETTYEDERDRKTGEVKIGKQREVHWVEWRPRGTNKSATREKVERYRKGDPLMWAAIRPAYERWTQGQAEPTDGIPLSSWAGVNKHQADAFRLIGVRTVEDVAAMNENTMQAFGMHARDLKARAAAYLESLPKTQVAETLANQQDQIAKLEAALAEATATIKAMAAQQGMEEKRKPGRPPKQQEAA